MCVTARGQPSYQSSSCTLVETEFLVQAYINRLAVLQDLKNSLASASQLTVETQRLQVGACYCMYHFVGLGCSNSGRQAT